MEKIVKKDRIGKVSEIMKKKDLSFEKNGKVR